MACSGPVSVAAVASLINTGTQQPQPTTSAGVFGHAHLRQTNDKIESDEDYLPSELHHIVSKVKLDVVLRGLPNEDLPPSLALIFPCVRRSPFKDNAVQHLDIVSCWKGLSLAQTLELTMWRSLFKQSLACQVQQHLLRVVVTRLDAYPSSTDESLLIPRMVECLSSEQPIVLHVSTTDLVHDIISRLYKIYRSDVTERTLGWSLASESLPDFVYNFARTQDCFISTANGLFLMFDLSNSYTVNGFAVFADLHWQLPRVTFSAFSTRLPSGDMYRIIPYSADTDPGACSYSGRSEIKDDVTYSITKTQLPLQWDSTQECFHALISKDSERTQQRSETIISTNISTPFSAGVRFERVLRHSVKLDVDHGAPTSAASSPDLSRCDSATSSSRDFDAPWLDPRFHSLLESFTDAQINLQQEHRSPWVPSYTSTPLSKTGMQKPPYAHPGRVQHRVRNDLTRNKIRSTCSGVAGPPYKRKTRPATEIFVHTSGSFALDKLDCSDRESDTKRRKLMQSDDIDVIMGVDPNDSSASDAGDDALFAHLERTTTGLMGEAHSSPTHENPYWFQKLERSDNDDTVKSNTILKLHHATLLSTKQTSFTWRGRKRPSNFSPPIYDISPPNTASATTSASTELLSQEQIQDNYQEFEQRKKQKDAEKAYYAATIPGFDGVVSPTDVEDRSFERIFMGDGDADEWMSDIEGVSEISEGLEDFQLEE